MGAAAILIALVATPATAAHALSGPPTANQQQLTPQAASTSCATSTSTQSYLEATAAGDVFSFGRAVLHGSELGQPLNQPVVGIASTPDGGGYWMVAADGGIFAFGDARFYGSMGAVHLNQPVVGIASTPDGGGYWMVAADGGIFAFGDARFDGSMGAVHLSQPVVGIASTPSGGGYWMVASDGGIFAFNAPFYGSTGNLHLAQPITSMLPTADGHGYRLIAKDGGDFNYGDATYQGSLAGGPLPAPVVSATPSTPDTTAGPAPTVDGSPTSADNTYFYYADAEQDVTSQGVSMQVCAAPGATAPGGLHTLTEMYVSLVGAPDDDGIELGIESSDSTWPDPAPRVWAAQWVNGNDTECNAPAQYSFCGFVPVPGAVAYPGMLAPVDSILSLAVKQAPGRWNLYADGQLMGYFPQTLWGPSLTQTAHIYLYGEVNSHQSSAPGLPMGNGNYGDQPNADQVTGYELFGTTTPADLDDTYESIPGDYTIANNTATAFSYGGPG